MIDMTTSGAGYAMIREHEGLRLEAYCCPGGKWTIGWGSTTNVNPGMKISMIQAQNRLEADIKIAEAGVKSLVKVVINQNQFDALVSFVFNLGSGALAKSTLLKLLNDGDKFAAAEQFWRWIFVGKAASAGLLRRRGEERQLFLSQVGA